MKTERRKHFDESQRLALAAAVAAVADLGSKGGQSKAGSSSTQSTQSPESTSSTEDSESRGDLTHGGPSAQAQPPDSTQVKLSESSEAAQRRELESRVSYLQELAKAYDDPGKHRE